MSGLVQWPQGFEKVSCFARQIVPRRGQLNPTKFALSPRGQLPAQILLRARHLHNLATRLRNFAEQMLANDLILIYLILVWHLVKLVTGKHRAVLADILFADVAAPTLAHAALHAQLQSSINLTLTKAHFD